MEYSKAELVDGQLKIVETKTVPQGKLSLECWTVQFQGLDACKNCESKDCGGKKIRKSGKNSLGFTVPL